MANSARLALFILLCGSFASGHPAAVASITDTFRKADLVVSGSATVLFSAGSYSGSVVVKTVLKGRAAIGSSVPVTWVEPKTEMVLRIAGRPEKPLQVQGIFFLRKAAGPLEPIPLLNGAWSFGQVYLPTLPRSKRGPVASALARQVKTVQDRIVLEIVSGIEAGFQLHYDLVSLYKETRSPVIPAALKLFQTSADPSLAARGYEGALEMGDVSSISVLYRNAKLLSTTPRWASILWKVQSFHDPANANAIAALETIVSDRSALLPLREAAANSLGQIHARRSLPYLAALLTEGSLTLRAAAVGGLAFFANGIPIGGSLPGVRPWPYRDRQTLAHCIWDEGIIARDGSYIAFWRNWWLTHRAELTAAPQRMEPLSPFL